MPRSNSNNGHHDDNGKHARNLCDMDASCCERPAFGPAAAFAQDAGDQPKHRDCDVMGEGLPLRQGGVNRG